MQIPSRDKAALKIAQRFSAGRTEAERAESRKGQQNRFFRPCGTYDLMGFLDPITKVLGISPTCPGLPSSLRSQSSKATEPPFSCSSGVF